MSNISTHHVWEAQLEDGRWEPYPKHTQLVLEAGLVDDAAPATAEIVVLGAAYTVIFERADGEHLQTNLRTGHIRRVRQRKEMRKWM